MKMPKIPALNAPEGYALLIGVGVLGFITLTWYLKRQAAELAAGVEHFNDGTPYAGTGVVGALGNVTDQLSGGFLSDQGTNLGSWLFDLFNSGSGSSSSDPNAVTLQTYKQSVLP